MATTIRTQPDELRRLLDDPGPAQAAAQRIAGRRTWLVGIGTSWHAAHHGAWLLRDAGIDAAALHAADVAPYARRFDAADAVIVLSHTGHTGYTAQALEAAREAGAAVVHVTGVGAGGDVETVVAETSYAYTASHTGALMRLAQMAEALGAALGDLAAVPDAVARVLDAPAAERRSARAPARAHRRRAQRVDRAGGGAEDPRGVLRRHGGPVRRAVPARPERRARRPGHARRARRRRPRRRAHGGDRRRDGGDRRARGPHRRARPRRAALDLPAHRLGAAHRARAGRRPAGSVPTASATRRTPAASRPSSRSASDAR